MDELFNSLYFTVSLNSYFINSLNYTTPVKTIYKSLSYPLSDKMMKNVEISIVNNYLLIMDGY